MCRPLIGFRQSLVIGMSAEMTSCDESPREFLTKTYKLKKEFYLPFSWILVSLCARLSLSFTVLISGRLEHARLFCFAGGFCATHKQNTYSGFMSFLSSLRLLPYGFLRWISLLSLSDVPSAKFLFQVQARFLLFHFGSFTALGEASDIICTSSTEFIMHKRIFFVGFCFARS